MDADRDNTQPKRQPEGKEGAGSHQEGKHSVQAGRSQRRERSEPEKGKPKSANDHQRTASGKKQHGPDDKAGVDGNEGSKRQNVDSRRTTGTGKEPEAGPEVL
jgi:hypothetical protein